MVDCKECGYSCEPRQSKTEKNPDRWFWSCPNRCSVWNGWLSSREIREQNLDEPKGSDDDDDSNSSGSDSSVHERKRPAKPAKPTRPKPAPQCVKCKKVLSLDHELENHVKRYTRSGLYYAAALDVRTELRKELESAFKSRMYTCEKCLHNE